MVEQRRRDLNDHPAVIKDSDKGNRSVMDEAMRLAALSKEVGPLGGSFLVQTNPEIQENNGLPIKGREGIESYMKHLKKG